uniref:Uncharacterized protein n=1 Tax=Cucumis melo TaxID=3656 RepID=A0A9I9EBN9_CUCME
MSSPDVFVVHRKFPYKKNSLSFINHRNKKDKDLRMRERSRRKCPSTCRLPSSVVFVATTPNSGLVVYAIIGAVVFRETSEIIYRESDLYVLSMSFKLRFHNGIHMLARRDRVPGVSRFTCGISYFQATLHQSRQISIEKSIVGRLHVVFRFKLAVVLSSLHYKKKGVYRRKDALAEAKTASGEATSTRTS